MYASFLFLHSLLRWVVLALGVVAIARAARGRAGARAREYSAGDSKASLFFMIATDVQLLFGLALYAGVSPITHAAFGSFGAAMKDRTLRFWMVEHPFAMVIAIVFVHVGRILVKRAADSRTKHTRALVWFSLAIVAMIAGIPWPFMPYGRPLLSIP
jgi:hypothetical protein